MAREKLRNEYEEATDYIIELEEKLFKANNLAVKMGNEFKQSEIENEKQKKMVSDLNKRFND